MNLWRRSAWLAFAGVCIAAVGMLGYVGGRMLADSRYVGVVRASTVVIFSGLALFATFMLLNAGRARRPIAFWAAGCILVVLGLLFVFFPYERVAAIPLAILTIALVAMLWLGWPDLCSPALWARPKNADRDPA